MLHNDNTTRGTMNRHWQRHKFVLVADYTHNFSLRNHVWCVTFDKCPISPPCIPQTVSLGPGSPVANAAVIRKIARTKECPPAVGALERCFAHVAAHVRHKVVRPHLSVALRTPECFPGLATCVSVEVLQESLSGRKLRRTEATPVRRGLRAGEHVAQKVDLGSEVVALEELAGGAVGLCVNAHLGDCVGGKAAGGASDWLGFGPGPGLDLGYREGTVFLFFYHDSVVLQKIRR